FTAHFETIRLSISYSLLSFRFSRRGFGGKLWVPTASGRCQGRRPGRPGRGRRRAGRPTPPAGSDRPCCPAATAAPATRPAAVPRRGGGPSPAAARPEAVQVPMEMQHPPSEGLEAVSGRDQPVARPSPELELGPVDSPAPGTVSRAVLVDVLFGLFDQR